MNDQLSIFGETTSPDTTRCIASPGLPSGQEPSPKPRAPRVGDSQGRSSPGHVHVSRFRSLDSKEAMSTNDTSGPLFTASSPSAALQRSLESRLRARTGGSGWPLFAMTWRPADMPSGPPSCQLAVSARRTSATAFSGWPTPRAGETSDNAPVGNFQSVSGVAKLAGWPTPTTRDHKDGGNPDVNVPLNALLGRVAWLAGWPTPQAHDPNKRGNTNADHHHFPHDLPNMAELAVGPARLTASGRMLTGSSAGTASGGQLDPRFSLWLMGLPSSWAQAAPSKAKPEPECFAEPETPSCCP